MEYKCENLPRSECGVGHPRCIGRAARSFFLAPLLPAFWGGQTALSIYLSPMRYRSTNSPLFTAWLIQFIPTPGILAPPGLPEKQPLPRVVVVQILSPVWFFASPMGCSRPGSSVLHCLLEFAQVLCLFNQGCCNHLILWSLLLLFAFYLSQHQGLFQRVSQRIGALALISNEYSGLISFRIDLFDLLAVQGTLKSLLQHHDLKASVLQHSVFFSTSNIFSSVYHTALSHIYFRTILHNMDNHCH